MRVLALLLAALALLSTAATGAERRPKRSKACDDGVARPRGVVCPSEPTCTDGSQLKALQHGCFYCVDPQTCYVAFAAGGDGQETETAAGAEAEAAAAYELTPVPSANAQQPSGKGVAMVKSSAGAANAALSVASKDDSAAAGASFNVNNLVFAAPVALAVVAALVALRARRAKPSGAHKFQRLQEEAATEEINPFCIAVLQQEDEGELKLELELSEEETKQGEEDEDCDAEAVVVARSILDDVEEEGDEAL